MVLRGDLKKTQFLVSDRDTKADLDYLGQALMTVRVFSTNSGQKEIAAQLLNHVAMLMRNVAARSEIFGRGQNFVPMLSVATYQKALQDALAALADNELSYQAYREKLQKTTDSAEQLETTARESGAMKDYFVRNLDSLNAERRRTQADIDGFESQLDNAKDRLNEELNILEQAINKDLGLSPATVINQE